MAHVGRQRLRATLYKSSAGWWEGLLLISAGGLLACSWSLADELPTGPRLFLMIAAAALVVRGFGELVYSRSRAAAVLLRLSALAGIGGAFVVSVVFEYERLGLSGLLKALAVLLILSAVIAAAGRFLPDSGKSRR